MVVVHIKLNSFHKFSSLFTAILQIFARKSKSIMKKASNLFSHWVINLRISYMWWVECYWLLSKLFLMGPISYWRFGIAFFTLQDKYPNIKNETRLHLQQLNAFTLQFILKTSIGVNEVIFILTLHLKISQCFFSLMNDNQVHEYPSTVFIILQSQIKCSPNRPKPIKRVTKSHNKTTLKSINMHETAK